MNSSALQQHFAGHVCISFYPQLGMMRRQNEPQALLVLPTDLVCVAGTFFVPANSARAEFSFDECCQWTTVDDLEDLFEAADSHRLKDWQAEVWVPDGVASADISKVKFVSMKVAKDAVAACEGIEAHEKTVFEVDPWRFPR